MNQAFDPEGSSGGAWGSGITRRSFIKRTGGATVASLVAWNLATQQIQAQNTVNIGNSSDGPWEYALKCIADPFDGGASPPNVGDGFSKSAPTETFDPNGIGDNATYDFAITGTGPHKGAISTSFAVDVVCAAVVYSPGGFMGINSIDLDASAEDSGQMSIDSTTGHITYMPDPPAQKTGSGGQPKLHIWAQVSPKFQAAGYTQYQNEGNTISLTQIEVGIATFNVPTPNAGTITRPVRTLDWTIIVVRRRNGGAWESAPKEYQP